MHQGNLSRIARVSLAMFAALGLTASRVLADDATELSKKTQNPVGDLLSVPFQFNYTTGGPLGDQTLSNLNIQPVFPVRLNERWMLVWRSIFPFLDIPVGPTFDDHAKGMGDVQQQIYLTSASPHDPIVAGGVVLSLPIATNPLARTGEWAAGPGIILVKNTGPWVLGVLANQIWSFASDGVGPKTNTLLVQPFINYNLQDGWAVSFAPIITGNFSAPDGEEWTVPLGLGLSKVMPVGRQPMSFSVQYYRNVERPSTVGDNQVRLVASLLFPVQK